MLERSKKFQKIDQLIITINNVIIEVEKFNLDNPNQEMEFQIVCCLAEARNLLDEMKFEIPEDNSSPKSVSIE